MASASDHRAHAALQPADCLILLPQRLPAAVETSIGPAHYPAECTQSDAFLQPSLRARYGRANSNSFFGAEVFLPRLPMTSLKDFAHGFHQSIISASHSRNRATARSRSVMSAIVASGFFFRISPTLLFPSATIQHPHFISQI